ncbi:MAG: hypothetical protein KDM64_12260 [Verrucomicrobiae bacterium]|nr:hypothetical protein [Verrucomicrobiae bacterium]
MAGIQIVKKMKRKPCELAAPQAARIEVADSRIRRHFRDASQEFLEEIVGK